VLLGDGFALSGHSMSIVDPEIEERYVKKICAFDYHNYLSITIAFCLTFFTV
jgi:hypothetical protein